METEGISALPDYIEVPEPSMERLQMRILRKVMDVQQEMAQELLRATTGLGRNVDISA